jgi:hypothetical protein
MLIFGRQAMSAYHDYIRNWIAQLPGADRKRAVLDDLIRRFRS